MKQIDDVVYNLVTRDSFIETFWETLRSRREVEPGITQVEVFEHLNSLYQEEFGQPRFPSYSAFRKERDKSK